jgi:integrase
MLWRDENNKPWLPTPVHVPMFPNRKCTQEARRRPYPLNPKEVLTFFNQYPQRAQKQLKPLKFILNTGLRDQECCWLSWDTEHWIEDLGRSIFYIDASISKNGYDRIVILNDEAWGIVQAQRGLHLTWVFPNLDRHGEPKSKSGRWYSLTTTQFKKYWVQAELPTEGFRVGVHNLRHTFGARLLQVGCPERYIKIFLGHKNEDITGLYTEGELHSLIKFANKANEVKTGVITRKIYKHLLTLEKTENL